MQIQQLIAWHQDQIDSNHTGAQGHTVTHAHAHKVDTELFNMVTHVGTCLSSPVILALGMGMTTTCWGATLGGITIPCHTKQKFGPYSSIQQSQFR